MQEPQSFEEARNVYKWEVAVKEELKTLKDNHTWDMVELPTNKKNCWMLLDLYNQVQ